AGLPGSVWLNARELDHLAPLLDVISDEVAEVGGRASKRRATQISELCLDLGISERRVDLLVELLDNLNGRVSRRADTPPSPHSPPRTRPLSEYRAAPATGSPWSLPKRLGALEDAADIAAASRSP